eukprot:6049571-Pyramimonas_sp.AAC.1
MEVHLRAPARRRSVRKDRAKASWPGGGQVEARWRLGEGERAEDAEQHKQEDDHTDLTPEAGLLDHVRQLPLK